MDPLGSEIISAHDLCTLLSLRESVSQLKSSRPDGSTAVEVRDGALAVKSARNLVGQSARSIFLSCKHLFVLKIPI